MRVQAHLRRDGEAGKALGAQEGQGHVPPHTEAGRRIHAGGRGGGGRHGGRRQLHAREEEDCYVGDLPQRRDSRGVAMSARVCAGATPAAGGE